jgi:hypothetical protein
MNKIRVAIQTSIFLILILGTSALVNAQATRTWVSGVGADDNPCSRTAPCKTFSGAQSKTATNGEINCLDPAGYGAITITKSITIDCEDTQGSILASLVNGVIINITSATDTRKAVMLRGISINGANNGINGVRIVRANDVKLDQVAIFGFAQHGISIETTTGALKLVVDHCIIRRNLLHGINGFPIGSTADISINESTLSTMGGNGLNFADNVTAAISDSVITANATGILASNAQVFASRCTIYKNTTGVQAQSGGTVRLFGNTITGNGTGLAGSTITAITGTNALLGNTSEGAATNFVNPLGP